MKTGSAKNGKGILLVSALAGGAAWLIEGPRPQADVPTRVEIAFAYLAAHRTSIRDPATIQGFANLLGRFDLVETLKTGE